MHHRATTWLRLFACVPALMLAACDTESGGTHADTTGAATTDAGTTDTAAADVAPAANTLLANGDYFLGIQAAPFGNLKLFFKLTVVAAGSLEAGGELVSLELRAVSKDGWVSEAAIGAAQHVVVAKGGTFSHDFGKVIMPGKATPTGTDVGVELKLAGTILADNGLCGDVDGFVPDFGAPLTGSKFKAVAWGKEKNPPESSCEGDQNKIYQHIQKCPDIKAGVNKLKSAELDREFQLILPADATTTTAKLPLVFLYHGVGGDSAGILQDTGFAELQQKHGFILVAPDSATVDGKKLKTDWYYGASLFDMDNPDLVFFDDMVQCLGGALPVDPQRVYVTGMSGGGLMSTFAAVHRSKIVAAAAPFSGGYLHKWPDPDRKFPTLVTWGGPTDKAFEQNFDLMAKELIANLVGSKHAVVRCEHTLGHKWPLEMNAAVWAFLSAHTLDGAQSPFAGAALPEAFPKYCAVGK